jgi:hypothetical protein
MGGILWLDGCLGLERRLALSQAEIVRLDRRCGEAAVRKEGGGGEGRASSLHCALAFTLQMRKNHGKTSVGVPERSLAKQRCTRFFPSTGSPFCVGLDWPVEPGRTKLARQAT